ncbi:DUF4132 domain-containing protein [Paenibacillus swuensis]|uniref:DUF4132 domain-containing protein n=1 Tax=Paenibacillus swuensis TaxID=1178515 RepID=UPI00083833D8|nr:DUF4132 domain-containing protein [Paenibacillus swuensis]
MKIDDNDAFIQLEQLIAKKFKDIESRVSYSIHDEVAELLERLLDEGEGQAYFAPLIPITRTIAGEYAAEIVSYLSEHITEYPYSRSYLRRPFRTRDSRVHLGNMLSLMFDLYNLMATGFSMSSYFTRTEPLHDYRFDSIMTYMIAYELDRNNEEIFAALKEIVFGDNQTVLLNRNMIRGIVFSHRTEAHVMLGQLLIAARLQEGLRQSIVETMDEGTMAAYVYLLQVIVDHDFIRYSSVIRALGVWTGLNLEAANTRVVTQCLEYAHRCLQDESQRQAWKKSEDVHKLYFALWATAVYEEDHLQEAIQSIMENGALYQQITAQYVLVQSRNKELRYKLAIPYLSQTDLELQSLIVANYGHQWPMGWYYHTEEDTYHFEKTPLLESKGERTRQFDLFRQMLMNMPKQEVKGNSRVFQWLTYNHTTDAIMNKLMYLAAYDKDAALLAQMIALKDRISPQYRNALIQQFTPDLTDNAQRQFLLDSLADKSVPNREAALERLNKMTLTSQEAESVQGLLKLKTGTLRQSAIQVLLKLDGTQLERTIQALITSSVELQRLGALELLCMLKEDEQENDRFERVQHHLSSLQEPSDKERTYMERLKHSEKKGLHNGFGLYDAGKQQQLHPWPYDANDRVNELFNMPLDTIKQFLEGLSGLVHEHREFEYTSEYYAGEKEHYLLGAQLHKLNRRWDQEPRESELDGYPLAEVWKKYYADHEFTVQEVMQMEFYFHSKDLCQYDADQLRGWEAANYAALGDWGREWLAELYPMGKMHEFHKFIRELPYRHQVQQLLYAYYRDCEVGERFQFSSRVLNQVIVSLQRREIHGQSDAWPLLVEPWLRRTGDAVYDDHSFAAYFALKHNYYHITEFNHGMCELKDWVRARELGLIEDEEIYRELLTRDQQSMNHMWNMTNKKMDNTLQSPTLQRFKETIVPLILDIELNRGDLATELSNLAGRIVYYEGMEYFIAILSRLDQETFVRGYIYGNRSKRESFSHLLRACHPASGDDVEKLARMLKNSRITDERLLEAAMYAPQWIELIAAYLDWPGLRSAAWYFHAHVNEDFSAEKETVVAHYSPISPKEFNDGAFDIHWFMSAYEQLGEKRFNMLYRCAKYISAGSNHRRSQLFADAVLGKLELQEMKASVIAKRNKDHLLCYSLVPIGDVRGSGVRERYEFIQRFAQESKKFGAQRSASEAIAVAIALDNLSRNAGYADVTRMKWDMESRKFEDMAPMLEPTVIDDLEVKLVVDRDGRAAIETTKQGKKLKTLPAKYSKHPYVLSLKEAVTGLRNQHKRAIIELEKSMESQADFAYEELMNLSHNPTLATLVHSLIWRTGEDGFLGFYHAGQLVNAAGQAYALSTEDRIWIAHPVHLYQSSQWSSYQKLLFDRQLQQPFKQVFRELYVPNADELDSGSHSRRYAGHQIQMNRTIALLKSRMWTVSYEEGLQKVYHKENIITQIYAVADWFAPSEIEAPTLESVSFIHRDTYKPIAISDVPPIIFSEVMRDVDLVVSTAHVGGVDPEASLTTIELRKVIIIESLRLLKIENVRLEGNFARISGALEDYGVHLGSGTVQKQAAGTLYILAVPSQHRGKLFLPFLDEDPRTSEILSKVVMLAQDTKIKDPSILEQLR